jgi:hypothetical protein
VKCETQIKDIPRAKKIVGNFGLHIQTQSAAKNVFVHILAPNAARNFEEQFDLTPHAPTQTEGIIFNRLV